MRSLGLLLNIRQEGAKLAKVLSGHCKDDYGTVDCDCSSDWEIVTLHPRLYASFIGAWIVRICLEDNIHGVVFCVRQGSTLLILSATLSLCIMAQTGEQVNAWTAP